MNPLFFSVGTFFFSFFAVPVDTTFFSSSPKDPAVIDGTIERCRGRRPAPCPGRFVLRPLSQLQRRRENGAEVQIALRSGLLTHGKSKKGFYLRGVGGTGRRKTFQNPTVSNSCSQKQCNYMF